MVLSSAQRREIIVRVASTHSPDLLLCAGYSLEDNDDLDQLAQDSRILKGKTTLIVEVKTDREWKSANAAGRQPGNASPHRVYLVDPGKRVQTNAGFMGVL